MPLPFLVAAAVPWLLGGAAATAGVVGAGAAIHGASKMKEANDTMQSAKARHENNERRFKNESTATNERMDKLGKLELHILQSFEKFSDLFEQIKNRPHFATYRRNDLDLPKYNREDLKKVSVGAGVILGGLGGAAVGTAGAVAASGATTAAVTAVGVASTGTAISGLSGAAATNAILAFLGGGSLAAGGGGMALGTAVLGGATLGVGLLVGGIIFAFSGDQMCDKADEAYSQMLRAEEKINKICDYLIDLRQTSDEYLRTLVEVKNIYKKHLSTLEHLVNTGRTDWNNYTEHERLAIENTVLLVGLLYNMCKVELVIKSDREDGINTINKVAISKSIHKANTLMADRNLR